MISISAQFDGGNISVVDIANPRDVQLEIRRDTGAEFFQWFCFRLVGARAQHCVLRITNAGQASYPRGWQDYQAVASEDRRHWFRVPTTYRDGELVIRCRPASDSMYFAYFVPYPMQRHDDLIARCQVADGVTLTVPGNSLEGRPLDVLRFGKPTPQKPSLWVIARQHPGETMAEWFVEGFLDRMLDVSDGAVRALRQRAAVFAVPNMNPDGSVRGNLRVNAAGANLNREWQSPDPQRSPEVLHVRRMMLETGIRLCLDVHGDEALPYNFIVGFEGIAEAGAEQRAALDRFRDLLASLNPDFQTEHGYPKAPPGKGNPTTSSGYLAGRHGVVAMTLEMPFKDALNAPDPVYGWSPERAGALGRSCVEALLGILDHLPADAAGT